uniref:Uncharacterized protein n=1 Tax=Geospiza parvula TaxID=87175 RepID=A0A8U8BYE0_GEOPR
PHPSIPQEFQQRMQRLAQAELQRYCQESSTQLLGTRNELARLHARLEAAHRDVLQWVRGMWGAQGPPGRGAAVQTPGVLHKEMPSVVGGAKVGCTPSGLS